MIMLKHQHLVLTIYQLIINGDFFRNNGIKLLKIKSIKNNIKNRCNNLSVLIIKNQFSSLCLKILVKKYKFLNQIIVYSLQNYITKSKNLHILI